MAVFVADLRHAVRLLRRTPGFTLAAACALALGLGPTVAMFAVVDAVLLRPLPVRYPERLVAVYADRGLTRRHFSYPDYVDLRDGQEALEGLAAVGASNAWFGETSPDRLSLQMVSGNYFDLLGLRMASAAAVDPGFDAGRVLLVSVDLGAPGYEPAGMRAFYRQATERVAAM